MDDSAITYNKIIESYSDKINLNKKINILKNTKFLNFTCIFINYNSIVDSCLYLLLCHKISGKTKTFITIS